MIMIIEATDFESNRLAAEPRKLLCLNCKRGGGDVPCAKVDELSTAIDKNPDVHITLVGAFDEIGARTERFDKQMPAERRKDLEVLQRLGLCFGDTRTARDLLYRISETIQSLKGICEYPVNEYGTWAECPLARMPYYAKGNNPLPAAQAPEEMAKHKALSCKALEETEHVVIRVHHLLCIICYAGREDNSTPLAEDNLMEAWKKFRENPDILVTVVEGPQQCCICPPCHSYNRERGLCVAGCHLRDRKKDLDTCVAIGVNPGETYTARALYKRIHEKIKDIRLICGYETDTSPEWVSCSSVGSGLYNRGLEACRIE
jgi:hypothetical protein